MSAPIPEAQGDYGQSRATKFKFKISKDRSHKRRSSDSTEGDVSSRHHHRRRHHHHRSKRRKTTEHGAPDDPSAYDDTHLPNVSSSAYLSPDAAFRESLFDALGDDEGAQYWEGVYGQPIHNYPNTRPGPEGELERMTDEEYAAFVRAKMWEKSHEHIVEERVRQAEDRKRRKEEKERLKGETESTIAFDTMVENSLRRGEERKRKKRWVELWEKYLRSWEELKGLLERTNEDDKPEKAIHLRNHLIWPVESGKRKDVNREEIENFMRHAPLGKSADGKQEFDFSAVLKSERIRWHPDKMQQRYGSLGIDEHTMKGVTGVFQVLDRMWNEQRHARA